MEGDTRGALQKRLAPLSPLELAQPPGLRNQQGSTSDISGDWTELSVISSSASSKKSPSQIDQSQAEWLEWASPLEADLQAVASLRIPRDAQGRLSSLGSLKHESGECRPCRFFFKSKGCKGARGCNFCHLDHDPMELKRTRACKGKRSRHSRQIARLTDLIHQDPDCVSSGAIELELPPSCLANQQAKNKMMPKLGRVADQVRQANASSSSTSRGWSAWMSQTGPAYINEAPVAHLDFFRDETCGPIFGANAEQCYRVSL